MKIWPPKDPDEDLDYRIDWRLRLCCDAISSVSHSVADGDVTIASEDHGRDWTKVRLSGGSINTKAEVLCEIVTTEGQTMQETASLLVRAR